MSPLQIAQITQNLQNLLWFNNLLVLKTLYPYTIQ